MSRISIVRGTTKNLEVALVDESGDPIDLTKLQGARAQFVVRAQPTDLTNLILFDTVTTPAALAFAPDEAALSINFAPGDTASLAIQLYFYQLTVTLSDGEVLDVIPWDIFDVNLGGSAQPAPAPFTNTVKIDENYQLPGDLAYFTPGGTPIAGAQVRLYYKSDYDAGNLSSPVGFTSTNAAGGWVNAILVQPGYSYVVRFEQPGSWGPDTAEISA